MTDEPSQPATGHGPNPDRAHDQNHDHGHHHGHGHGHEHDQGWRAMLRYARHARQMWTSEINEAVVRRLAPAAGETVVDIGAGAGAGTMVAAATGATVIAVEPTGYMRRVLGWRRLASSKRSNISVVDGSAEATGLSNNTAQAVWAVNTMHHWTNVNAAITELARMVAPGGRVLLVDEDFDDPRHPDYERFSQWRNDDHTHHFDMVDTAAMSKDLTAAGFVVTHAGQDQIIGRPVLLIEAHRTART